MKKTFNKGGDAAFKIKTDHLVTLTVFCKALAEHCWNAGIDFNPKMSKTEGIKILKNSLFYNGIKGGEDLSRYEGASEEAVSGFENAYPLAKEWVLKNYPYLDTNYYDGKES